MKEEINIYCDESCHLERDGSKVMVIGAVWCPSSKRHEIFERIREIKAKHGMHPGFEMKWHKISPAKTDFYLDICDYFFDDDDLHYRGLLIPDKSELNHGAFGQTHNDWYYKMFFDLLKVILNPEKSYNIYLDIKDTQSQSKVEHLHEVLANSNYDFERRIVKRLQQVHSHEVEVMQLTDLLTGAIGYHNRGLTNNAGKVSFIERMQHRSGYSLKRSTLLREEKVNLFVWHGNKVAR